MSKEFGPIGKVEVLSIRTAFPKEAHHFTKWLETNIDALSERLGISLTVLQREKSVGDFNVDLLCEDEDHRPVIVENQLERTDHDHLGKLLTYFVNLDASAGIWITGEPRPEHLRVVDWLNESTPAGLSFYLVKVEAIQIGDSPIAPYFSVISGPDNQAKVVGEKKKEWADRHYKRYDFWKSLLELSRPKTALYSGISPTKDHWLNMGAGRSGIAFEYVILMDSAWIGLYINADKGDGALNKKIFDQLLSDQKSIESEVGHHFSWERMEGKQASRIRVKVADKGLDDKGEWPSIQSTMIDAMIKFEKAIKPRLEKVKV